MKAQIVRYRTLPDQLEANVLAVRAVFRELEQKNPDGIRYAAMHQADGTFHHLVMTANESPAPLTSLESFREFLSGVNSRCIELPTRNEVKLVGNYRMVVPL